MTRPDLEETQEASFGEAAAIGRIERALFGGDAELVRVGRYEIVERIGAGAFGRVYRAKDPQLGRTIALKVFEVTGVLHDDLLGEAKTMAALGHPNVASIFDAGVLETEPQRVFIAMELVVGRNLREWLSAPRTVQAILDVLSQVGQGLVAAHAAGIVHRDVKPENVLVGDDGRVRVVDFGLARASGVHVHDDAPMTTTRTGTIAGTPAYMAPELFDGAAASIASDQFAYCATLWEALYAARPYGGASVEQLREAYGRPLPDPPRKPRVPRAITRALERGLARDPAARFPSMTALLDAIARARSRRRIAIAALVGTAALGVTAGVVLARRDHVVAPTCARPVSELAGVWDAPTREVIAKSFEATGVANAKATFDRTAKILDRLATGWLDAHYGACVATHVKHAQSAVVLDRRMACLRDWRRRFAALTERLTNATPSLVGLSTRAASELPSVARCADEVTLDGPARPTDPEIEKKLDELDGKLAAAQVQFFLGEGAAALESAEEVVRESATLNYEPTQINALLWQGEALIVNGRYEDARGAGRKCFNLALGVRDHRSAALCASVIAFTGAFDSSEAAESLDWVRTGESLRAKLDGADDVAAKLAHVEGNVYLTAADPANAKPALERAIAMWRKLDVDHPNQSTSLAMLGVAEMYLGQIEPAREHLLDANQRAERDLGSEHPELAAGLINYSLVELALGNYADAAKAIDRGLDLQVKTLGESHPLVGYTRLNRGQLAAAMGDRERADREFTLAREIADASYGENHAVAVTISLAAGEHYARTGRGNTAREHAQRAFAATSPQDHGPRALALATLAFAEAVRGDAKVARSTAARARAELEASTATPSQRMITLDLVGEALAAIKDPAARAALESALAQTGGPPDATRSRHIRDAIAKLPK